MSLVLDRVSLLVETPASMTLSEVEQELSRVNLTLRLPVTHEPVGDWLARGAPGSPNSLSDPSDHLIAGLTATLRSGLPLVVRPAPRRSAGPDLVALIVGAHHRFAKLERVWLRVHISSSRPVSLELPAIEREAPLSDGELAILSAIERELDR
jgi:alkyldihydroxyacetonephosphate synthase